MNTKERNDLVRASVVQSLKTALSYVVIDNSEGCVIAVRTVEITVPGEWVNLETEDQVSTLKLGNLVYPKTSPEEPYVVITTSAHKVQVMNVQRIDQNNCAEWRLQYKTTHAIIR